LFLKARVSTAAKLGTAITLIDHSDCKRSGSRLQERAWMTQHIPRDRAYIHSDCKEPMDFLVMEGYDLQ
jgi:hypothetical protein